MAGMREARASHYALNFLAQQRNFLRICVVGAGCIKAYKTTLTDHLAANIEALDADVIQIAYTMYRGA